MNIKINYKQKNNSRNKIAIIDSSNAVYLYEHNLCKALSSNGVETHLIASKFLNEKVEIFYKNYKREEIFYQYSTYVLLMVKNKTLNQYIKYISRIIGHIFSLIELHYYIKKNNIEIIHYQWTQLPFIDNFFIKFNKNKCKFIYTVHNTNFNHGHNSYISNLQKFGYKKFVKLMDALIVHTEYSKINIINNFKIIKNIYVVPHGKISCFNNYCNSDIDLLEKKYLIKKETRIIFFFGNINHYKGLDILLDAYEKIGKEIKSQTKLIILGRNQDKIDLSKYKKNPDIIFDIGYVEDRWIEPIFKRGELIILPYRDIDQSGVLLTAINYEKSIITSDLKAFKEIFGDNSDLHTFNSEDVNDLARMISLYLTYDDISKKNNNNIKSLSNSWITWDHVAELTCEVYANTFN